MKYGVRKEQTENIKNMLKSESVVTRVETIKNTKN